MGEAPSYQWTYDYSDRFAYAYLVYGAERRATLACEQIKEADDFGGSYYTYPGEGWFRDRVIAEGLSPEERACLSDAKILALADEIIEHPERGPALAMMIKEALEL